MFFIEETQAHGVNETLEAWPRPGIEPGTSEVTGVDVSTTTL